VLEPGLGGAPSFVAAARRRHLDSQGSKGVRATDTVRDLDVIGTAS
jgi:hypothetical protein